MKRTNKLDYRLCLGILSFGILIGFLISYFTLDNTNSSISADRVEYMLENIETATYRQFNDNSTIGGMKQLYDFRRLVARSMLEYQLDNICGDVYVSNYDENFNNVIKSCGCELE